MLNMTEPSVSKLNRLQRELPEGFVVDAAWLSGRGYSSSLRNHYVSAGWLTNPARRVYSRPQKVLDWKGVILSLQNLLGYPLAIGGRTALEQLGYSHYLSGSTREVHLYGSRRPPTWLDQLDIGVAFHYHNSLRLFSTDAHQPIQKTPAEPFPGNGWWMASAGGVSLPLALSSPERALLELLDELPTRESFHQVDMLVEGLANLRPSALQTLLEDCRSVKVKRLFFFFADRHSHAWLKKIDRTSVHLGSGNRMLVKGGKLDQRYRITVPEDMYGAP